MIAAFPAAESSAHVVAPARLMTRSARANSFTMSEMYLLTSARHPAFEYASLTISKSISPV